MIVDLVSKHSYHHLNFTIPIMELSTILNELQNVYHFQMKILSRIFFKINNIQLLSCSEFPELSKYAIIFKIRLLIKKLQLFKLHYTYNGTVNSTK